MRKIVAIVGDSRIDKDGLKYKLAYETGKALVDHGYRLQSGGLAGVMEAAFEGAKASEKSKAFTGQGSGNAGAEAGRLPAGADPTGVIPAMQHV